MKRATELFQEHHEKIVKACYRNITSLPDLKGKKVFFGIKNINNALNPLIGASVSISNLFFTMNNEKDYLKETFFSLKMTEKDPTEFPYVEMSWSKIPISPELLREMILIIQETLTACGIDILMSFFMIFEEHQKKMIKELTGDTNYLATGPNSHRAFQILKDDRVKPYYHRHKTGFRLPNLSPMALGFKTVEQFQVSLFLNENRGSDFPLLKTFENEETFFKFLDVLHEQSELLELKKDHLVSVVRTWAPDSFRTKEHITIFEKQYPLRLICKMKEDGSYTYTAAFIKNRTNKNLEKLMQGLEQLVEDHVRKNRTRALVTNQNNDIVLNLFLKLYGNTRDRMEYNDFVVSSFSKSQLAVHLRPFFEEAGLQPLPPNEKELLQFYIRAKGSRGKLISAFRLHDLWIGTSSTKLFIFLEKDIREFDFLSFPWKKADKDRLRLIQL